MRYEELHILSGYLLSDLATYKVNVGHHYVLHKFKVANSVVPKSHAQIVFGGLATLFARYIPEFDESRFADFRCADSSYLDSYYLMHGLRWVVRSGEGLKWVLAKDSKGTPTSLATIPSPHTAIAPNAPRYQLLPDG